MSVGSSAYSRFDDIFHKYLPPRGEGNTLAQQIVTAVNKIVYKWYNDGDVYDNTGNLNGWANDLSDYANWLYKYAPGSQSYLSDIFRCETESDYEDLLFELASVLLDSNLLATCDQEPKQGSIYNCDGPFEFVESYDDDEDDEDYEEWEDDWVLREYPDSEYD